MVKITQKGDFTRVTTYLERAKKHARIQDLEAYAKRGVEALAAATPVDSGVTASSWYYKIENQNGKITMSFCNSNIVDGVPIAIILQYGHATRNGGWVEGRDYINPAIQPIFDEITKEAWKEVTKA